MLPTHRPPTPPGAMLLEEYLKPRGITQVDLAARMGVPVQRVNTLINGKRGVTAETAILLSVESKPSWPRIAAHDGQLTSSYTSALRHALAAERRVLFE